MDRYSVIVSQRADEMLVKHTRFLAQVSVPAATRMADEFERILDALERNPFQFPSEDAYAVPQGFRKALFCKWYKAVFSVSEETREVYLDAVLDCRQDHSQYRPN